MADLKLLVSHESDTGRVRQRNEDYVDYFIPTSEAQLGTAPEGGLLSAQAHRLGLRPARCTGTGSTASEAVPGAVQAQGSGTPQGIPQAVLCRKGAIFLVADGMGGHQAGGIASQEAVKWVIQEYYADTARDVGSSLTRAFESANEKIFEMAQADVSKAGMGTTLVAAVILDRKVTIANIGDSRAYLLHRKRFTRITVDHSWVEEQVRTGALTREQAEKHPQRNLITRALGTRPSVEVDLFEVDLDEGDVLLLCTDGLSGQISEQQMAQRARSMPPSQAAAELIALANAQGGRDNASVAIVQIGSREEGSRSWWQAKALWGTASEAVLRRELRQRLRPVLWPGTGSTLSLRTGQAAPRAVVAGLVAAVVVCLCALAAILPLANERLVGNPAAAPRPAPIRFEDLTEEALSQLASTLGYGGLAEMKAAHPGRLDAEDLPVVDLSPANQGVFLVGLVRDWNCREGNCRFRLKMAGEAYQVELEQDHLLGGLSSLRGRRVRVFGYRLGSGLPSAQAQGTSQQVAENGVVDARLIDLGVRWWVWWRPAWGMVYRDQDGGKAVWVYSIVDRNPYSTIEMEEHPTLKQGEWILARGQWLPGVPAEYGPVAAVRPYRGGEGSMTFVVESLYRLEGDVYIPVTDEPATTPQPTVTLRPTLNP